MSDYPVDSQARAQIAQSLLGPIDERGYCRCPGAELHTHKSGPRRPERPGRDCRVYLGASAQNPRGVPTVVCVHSSCSGVVGETNHKLRSEIARHEARQGVEAGYRYEAPKQRKRSREEVEAEQGEKVARAMGVRARVALPAIVRGWPWEEAEMWEASGPLPEPGLAEARALVGLFPREDVVWCGDFKDSIAAEDVERASAERVRRVRGCFREAGAWLAEEGMPGPRICPNAMRPGVLSRAEASVLARRFLVVEHDALSVAEQGAVLRWLREEVGLGLRAVVHTGGKSLHGWLDCPAPADLGKLETVLVAMGYDAASFRAQQPFRVPGWVHEKTGVAARLWFLGGGR